MKNYSSHIFMGISLFMTCLVFGEEGNSVADSVALKNKVLILPPLSLNTGEELWGLQRELVNQFRETGLWKTISLAKIVEKAKKYEVPLKTNCQTPECIDAFSAWTSVDYVLFGTVNKHEDLYSFRANIIDVESSNLVYARVFNVNLNSAESRTSLLEFSRKLNSKLRHELSGVTPQSLGKVWHSSKKALGILSLNSPSEYSDILNDQLRANLISLDQYHVIDQNELNYLLRTLDIPITELQLNTEKMLKLGAKLQFDFLVCSQVSKEGEQINLFLGYYDVAKQVPIVELPFQSTDFEKVLEIEREFTRSLPEPEIPATDDSRPIRKSGGSLPIALLQIGSVILLTSTTYLFLK